MGKATICRYLPATAAFCMLHSGKYVLEMLGSLPYPDCQKSLFLNFRMAQQGPKIQFFELRVDILRAKKWSFCPLCVVVAAGIRSHCSSDMMQGHISNRYS